jgi:hypothetical protein
MNPRQLEEMKKLPLKLRIFLRSIYEGCSNFIGFGKILNFGIYVGIKGKSLKDFLTLWNWSEIFKK